LIFVIDASVAVKWFVDEERRDKARELLRDGVVRLVPEIIFAEVANALRKKVAAGEISLDQASYALDDLPVYLPNVVPINLILNDAFDLGTQLGHPVADCLYLACARHIGGKLVTDDEKFFRKCQGQHSSSTVLMRNWIAPIDDLPPKITLLDPIIEAKLTRLSALYQQAKTRLGRHWFEKDVVILAERALKSEILSLDKDQRAYVLALCWFGAIERWEQDQVKLRSIWLDRLAYARDNVGGDTEPDLIYIIARLQDLEIGLLRLSSLSRSDTDHDL